MIDEEQEAFDNLPESLQGAEKGTLMEETIESLTSASDSITEVIEMLDTAAQ